MALKEITETMKNININLLNLLDEGQVMEENLQNLQKRFEDQDILNNQYMLHATLHMMAAISNNHNRSSNFFEILEKILEKLKFAILKNFTNIQIFHFFKCNKRILLYLINEKILKIDNYIFNYFKEFPSYNYYFYPEISTFLTFKDFDESNQNEIYVNQLKHYYKNKEDFIEKRKIGENPTYICQLIRKDMIEDFIVYINKNSYDLNTIIEPSIFESNLCLLDEYLSLIEYAAFFGSVQIFKFLVQNGAALTSTLWIYSIHGNNPELFELLKEYGVLVKDMSCKSFFIESVKCHHNDFANFYQNNYCQSNQKSSFEILSVGLKYHNFAFIDSFYIGQFSFYDLCLYDYPIFVDYLLKTTFIEINKATILYILFFFIKF